MVEKNLLWFMMIVSTKKSKVKKVTDLDIHDRGGHIRTIRDYRKWHTGCQSYLINTMIDSNMKNLTNPAIHGRDLNTLLNRALALNKNLLSCLI